jgi:histidinol-phosphate aminotransferase
VQRRRSAARPDDDERVVTMPPCSRRERGYAQRMRPLVAPHFKTLIPYVPGKPIEETQREFGLTEIAKLASNENALGPSPRATAAVAEQLKKAHLYPDADGFYLKAAIAELHKTTPPHVVLGNGTNEIISLLTRALLSPDDALLNAWPSFVCYRIGARASGAPELTVPLTPDHRYDLPALGRAAKENRHVKLVFLANPNNPTGQCFNASALDAFLGEVPDDVVVVLDEAYADYVDGIAYPDGSAIVKQRPRTLLLRTFSKIHGLAAYRVGYGVGDVELVTVLNQLRDAFNVSALAQTAALAALGDSEHLATSKAHNLRERPRLAAGLTALGFTVTPSQGNFVLATLPDSLDLDVPTLNVQLLKRGVIVRPVANYGITRGVRITVGTVAENDRLLGAARAVLAGERL